MNDIDHDFSMKLTEFCKSISSDDPQKYLRDIYHFAFINDYDIIISDAGDASPGLVGSTAFVLNNASIKSSDTASIVDDLKAKRKVMYMIRKYNGGNSNEQK